MTNQNIKIHNESNINAIGEHNCSKCKSVICKETGDIYTSIIDAANGAGVHYSMMCGHLNGRYKSVKGKHYDYLDNVIDNPDDMFAKLREVTAIADANAKRADANEADARKWREYQAQLAAEAAAEAKRIEKERKEKEKHDAKVAKTKAKEARIKAKCAKLEAQLSKEVGKLMSTQRLLNLLNGVDADEDVA